MRSQIFRHLYRGRRGDGSRVALGQLIDGVDDVSGADAVLDDEVVGWAGAGHLPHGQNLDLAQGFRQGSEHRLSETALGVVVLDGDDAAAALESVLHHGSSVQGLDGEGVEHAGVHAALLERLGRLHRLVQRNAGTDQQHGVLVRLAHHMRLASLGKDFIFN